MTRHKTVMTTNDDPTDDGGGDVDATIPTVYIHKRILSILVARDSDWKATGWI